MPLAGCLLRRLSERTFEGISGVSGTSGILVSLLKFLEIREKE